MNALVLIDPKVGVPSIELQEYIKGMVTSGIAREVLIGNDLPNPLRGDVWKIFSQQQPRNLLSNPVVKWERGTSLDDLTEVSRTEKAAWLVVSSLPVVSMALAGTITVVLTITNKVHPDCTFNFSSQPEMVMLDTFSSQRSSPLVRTYVCMPAVYPGVEVQYNANLDFDIKQLNRNSMLQAKLLDPDGAIHKVGHNGYKVELSGGYGPCEECLRTLHERGISTLKIDRERARQALGLPGFNSEVD